VCRRLFGKTLSDRNVSEQRFTGDLRPRKKARLMMRGGVDLLPPWAQDRIAAVRLARPWKEAREDQGWRTLRR